MNLPGSDQAEVHPSKVLHYLLDRSNPAGRGKPELFRRLGYTRQRWGRLSDELIAHGRTFPVSRVTQDREHQSYTYPIDGELEGRMGVDSKSPRSGVLTTRLACHDSSPHFHPRAQDSSESRRPPTKIHDYDVVEILSDHPELSPDLVRGARGVVVDLPLGLKVAAVEFDLVDQIDVFLLDVEALQPVEPRTSLQRERHQD